jgi:hypothetical protein
MFIGSGDDKAAVGNGGVGDTLATRDVQANFIATWAVTVNVHVDINGRERTTDEACRLCQVG